MNNKESITKDICFIHEDRAPELDSRSRIFNRINFLPLASLRKNLLQEDPICRLVFFPLKAQRNVLYKEIRTIFPRAQFVSYAARFHPDIEKLSRKLNFSLHVNLPLSTSLVEYLYQQNSSLMTQMEKKRSLENLQDNKFVGLFNEILKVLDINQEKEAVYREFALVVSRLLECENFLIYVLESDRKQLELVFATRPVFEENQLLDFRFSNVILEEVFQRGEPFVDNDFNREFAIASEGTPFLIRSILILPFKSQVHSSGLFVAINKSNREGFDNEDVQYLDFLSSAFNLIHDSLVHHERIQRLSVTDDLTNLYNFRYLRQYLGFEIKRSLRYDKKLSLLFIDIDNFKDVNDTYGHLVGSAVLCEVGQLFHKMVRDTDIVIRYGGDEFVIILPETDTEGAGVIAERLRDRVESHLFRGGRSLDINLTVSIGVACCPQHSITAEGLLQKADAAMYAAKNDSKNNIKIAG